MTKFKNEAKKKNWAKAWREKRPSDYDFEEAPKLLFQWSRAFQAIVSQTLTHYYSGKFHDTDCGIYKCEGGCNVPGTGELCLQSSYCYWDMGGPRDRGIGPDARCKAAEKPAELITKMVLEWDPMAPVESLMESAAEWLDMPLEAFKDGVKGAKCGQPFGGNALSSFFDWNPFSNAPLDQEYRRYCLINHGDMTKEEVDALFADEQLGSDLLAELQKKCREHEEQRWYSPMCCRPRRMENGELKFWINTGRKTVIDGWRSEAEIRKFLAGDGKLNDTANY